MSKRQPKSKPKRKAETNGNEWREYNIEQMMAYVNQIDTASTGGGSIRLQGQRRELPTLPMPDIKMNLVGFTKLHVACLQGLYDKVLKLLDEGAKFTGKIDMNGSTPLHLASWKGHTDIAILLVERGADMSATAHEGNTPLHQARSFLFCVCNATFIVHIVITLCIFLIL